MNIVNIQQPITTNSFCSPGIVVGLCTTTLFSVATLAMGILAVLAIVPIPSSMGIASLSLSGCGWMVTIGIVCLRIHMQSKKNDIPSRQEYVDPIPLSLRPTIELRNPVPVDDIDACDQSVTQPDEDVDPIPLSLRLIIELRDLIPVDDIDACDQSVTQPNMAKDGILQQQVRAIVNRLRALSNGLVPIQVVVDRANCTFRIYQNGKLLESWLIFPVEAHQEKVPMREERIPVSSIRYAVGSVRGVQDVGSSLLVRTDSKDTEPWITGMIQPNSLRVLHGLPRYPPSRDSVADMRICLSGFRKSRVVLPPILRIIGPLSIPKPENRHQDSIRRDPLQQVDSNLRVTRAVCPLDPSEKTEQFMIEPHTNPQSKDMDVEHEVQAPNLELMALQKCVKMVSDYFRIFTAHVLQEDLVEWKEIIGLITEEIAATFMKQLELAFKSMKQYSLQDWVKGQGWPDENQQQAHDAIIQVCNMHTVDPTCTIQMPKDAQRRLAYLHAYQANTPLDLDGHCQIVPIELENLLREIGSKLSPQNRTISAFWEAIGPLLQQEESSQDMQTVRDRYVEIQQQSMCRHNHSLVRGVVWFLEMILESLIRPPKKKTWDVPNTLLMSSSFAWDAIVPIEESSEKTQDRHILYRQKKMYNVLALQTKGRLAFPHHCLVRMDPKQAELFSGLSTKVIPIQLQEAWNTLANDSHHTLCFVPCARFVTMDTRKISNILIGLPLTYYLGASSSALLNLFGKTEDIMAKLLEKANSIFLDKFWSIHDEVQRLYQEGKIQENEYTQRIKNATTEYWQMYEKLKLRLDLIRQEETKINEDLRTTQIQSFLKLVGRCHQQMIRFFDQHLWSPTPCHRDGKVLQKLYVTRIRPKLKIISTFHDKANLTTYCQHLAELMEECYQDYQQQLKTSPSNVKK